MLTYTVLAVISGLLIERSLCQTSSVSARCPDGFNHQYNQTCYLLSHDKEPWINALLSCQMLGGHLVEVESAEEANFLRSICQNKGNIRWIALTNKRDPNSWEWATSHKKLMSSYKNWASGEPDDYGHDGIHDESCGAMDGDPKLSHQYQWADLQCFRQELYICEAQLAPILPYFGRR